MAKQNGKVPGTFVSDKDMNDLNTLLSTYRDYILSHEARIELIEGWIGEFHKEEKDSESPEISEVYLREAGLLDEPTDDPA